jgi:high-affinity Fe2+/Pb2+ permease
VLFTLAALSSPTPHRASHAGIALLTVGCLSAATLSWTGMRFAAEAHSRWRVPLMLYGLAVGLFFLGETVAVVLLNW